MAKKRRSPSPASTVSRGPLAVDGGGSRQAVIDGVLVAVSVAIILKNAPRMPDGSVSFDVFGSDLAAPPTAASALRAQMVGANQTHLFGMLDEDGNGSIDVGDEQHDAASRFHNIVKAWDEIDVNGDGAVSKAELTHWLQSCPADEIVVQNHFWVQCLSSMLVGMGMGGLAGTSTLGVSYFALWAPAGYACQYMAIVPVVCMVSSFSVFFAYLSHAQWGKCFEMWPALCFGIFLGQHTLPLFSDRMLNMTCAIVYGIVLTQRIAERTKEILHQRERQRMTAAAGGTKGAAAKKARAQEEAIQARLRAEKATHYNQRWVGACVALFCGWITIIANSSGPIFDVFLLSCGFSMNEFVATRGVFMAANNVFKVVIRLQAGSLTWRGLYDTSLLRHGLVVGLCAYIGVHVAKPAKKLMTPQVCEYCTWPLLAYTCYKLATK